MKITEYPKITKLEKENVFLVDGPSGTKTIEGEDLPFASIHLTSPEMHRMIFRGKNLGSTFTTTQKARVQDGTFEDLWLGDYWVIGDRNWRIVDINYWYNAGDTAFTKPHLVIMPDTGLYNGIMNSTATTTGGYANSDMRITNLTSGRNMSESAFPGSILTRRDNFTNAVTNGAPSGSAWFDSKVELPNETMIFGNNPYMPASTGTVQVRRTSISQNQLAIFAVAPRFISNRDYYWLRDVANATMFTAVGSYGASAYDLASIAHGVRPVFAVG